MPQTITIKKTHELLKERLKIAIEQLAAMGIDKREIRKRIKTDHPEYANVNYYFKIGNVIALKVGDLAITEIVEKMAKEEKKKAA